MNSDFPGSSVARNPCANAGDTGWIPDLGRSHMTQSNQGPVPQLRKPEHPEPMTCNRRSHCSEKLGYYS